MNPRAAINDLLPFQGSPFGQLGYFSKSPYLLSKFFIKLFLLSCDSLFSITDVPLFVKHFLNLFFKVFNKRREWDSNPRALADKRFSRPPRYDHFDTSPANLSHRLCQRKMYITIIVLSCQYTFTSFFLFFLVFPKFPILYNDIRNFKVFWCRNFYIFI